MIVEKQPFRCEAAEALEQRTASVDDAVCRAFAEFLSPCAEPPALLAVGGYGRRQLFPHSDVDLLLLFGGDGAVQGAREAVAAFLRQLWDRGLRVSHSVRTPAECSELHDQNIELNISLLDQRFLAGAPSVYAMLMERLPRFIHGQRSALVRNLSRLTRERHQKFHDTFYHLEPNIKEAPGGLRDFQLLCWLDRINRTTSTRLEGGPPPGLGEAYDFLASLRCHLHHLAGRDNNILSFEAQDAIAEQCNGGRTAEWMRQYFRHARDIYRSALRSLETQEAQGSSLFTQFRDWRSRLSNADFTVSRERVQFRSPQALDGAPDLLLRLFAFVARHGIRLSLEAEQRIASRLPRFREHFSQSRAIWPALKEILSLPHASLALRAMHDTGILQILFPELEQIDCLVIRDFYHRYTVDEHTLVAIQALMELRRTAEAASKPYAEIYSELEGPWLLVFALLFHDAGKSAHDGGHVEGSLAAAEPAMERIGMPEEDRETVRFLIRNHLEMSAAMHSRDLFDPATAELMAHRAGTEEWLKALTLMTWADISAVNPAAMTPWRAEQLWQLYVLTYNELTRELDSERIQSAPAESPEKTAFIQGFPTRYLRTHSSAQIDIHMRLDEESRDRGAAVEVVKAGAVYRLVLVTRDKPFLFASAAGTLSGFGMNILKAEAFSNRCGTVLDTFTFSDPLRSLELNPSEIDRLRSTALRVVLGRVDVKKILQNRPKSSPPSRKARLKPSITFDPEASGAATLIQIVAEDRPALLYELAAAISAHGCNIEVVLINTEAHKAVDVFYVTSEGGKLAPEKMESLGRALRAACA